MILRLVFLLLFALSAQAQLTVMATGLSAEEVGQLQAAAPSNVRVLAVSRGELESGIGEADAVIGTLNRDLFLRAKKLKWMQTHSAGVDNLRYPELIESDVVLTNAKIVMGPNIADHAFALLLSLTRKINIASLDTAESQWRRGGYAGKLVELNGKTALIVGVGGIGMQIAQRAKGFGMHVIGVDPKDIPITPLVDELVHPDALDEVLPRADVLFVSAPLTEQTRGMIGPKQFDAMKRDSYFIAVSRGPLYQTPALLKALDSGRLAGAGLDVTDPEPLPEGHALWKFSNVVITPHVAGQGDVMPVRRMEVFVENVRRFGEGRPLLNVVDKQKGY
jgi:phosphoglycerate dehydrogenase-like enzyme